MTICGNCGSTEMEDDNGMLVCTQCGAVVEDQNIVSEVQFQENSGGGVMALGQFVSSEGKHARVAGSRSYGQRDSRQYTLDNGRNRIQQLACNLNMSSYCADVAYNYFKLAVSKSLTKGRKSIHVAAACLYIVCRTEKKPLMLLDFSDKLGIDVYTLGHTYLQLSKDLYITIPAIDPALYIERYAHKMEYGDKTMDVCRTATRLVSRMGRDWMVQGRRPSGICGAALLVASRIYNFNRTVHDVMRVVRIGEQTIKKRLSEFEQTPSSQLTIEEFNNINLETAMDPPCFIEAKKKAKLQELEDKGELPKLLEMIDALREELEVHIQRMIDKKNRKWLTKKNPLNNLQEMSEEAPSTLDLDNEIAQYEQLLASVPDIKDEVKRDKGTKEAADDDDKLTILKEVQQCDVESLIRADLKHFNNNNNNDDNNNSSSNNNDNNNNNNSLNDNNDELNSNDRNNLANNEDGGGLVDEGDVVSGLVAATIKQLINEPCVNDNNKNNNKNKNNKVNNNKNSDTNKDTNNDNTDDNNDDVTKGGASEGTNQGGDDDFADLEDDEEIKEIILSEEEVKIKMTLWMRENADFLKLMKEKEERKAKELQDNPELGKKKRRTRRARARKEADTAEEAIAQIVQLKKLSNKINYDVLVDFNIDSINNFKSDKPCNNNEDNKIEGGTTEIGKTEGGLTEVGKTEVGKTEVGVKRKLGGICNLVRPSKRDRIDTPKQKKNSLLNMRKINSIPSFNASLNSKNNKNNNNNTNDNNNNNNDKNKNNEQTTSLHTTKSESQLEVSKGDVEDEVDESFFFEQDEPREIAQVEEESFDNYTDDWDD